MNSPRQDRLNSPAQEAAWLDVAADEKAESVARLVANRDVKTVVEIGAGSGAVLGALDRLGFAERYWACEPAADLLAQMKPNSRLVEAVPKTFDHAFPGMTFDLAILSHVVEHLLAPAPLIAEALQRARLVVVEVPIEGSAAGNARFWIKERMGYPKLENEAGHVQFFSRREARELITHSGGALLAERGYFPIAPYTANADRGGRPLHRRLMLRVAKVEPVARHYYEHFAMLCAQTRLDSWEHVYAPPR